MDVLRTLSASVGHHVYCTNTCIFKPDKSLMILDKNGRDSSGEITRQINIIYFFVLDRVKSGEVNIKYYPTDYTIGEYFTKPLKGAKLRNSKIKY